MKKQIFSVFLAAAAAIMVSSCGSVETSGSNNSDALSANASVTKASSWDISDTDPSSKQSVTDTSSQSDDSGISSQADEKTYTITESYDNSWDITGRETIAEIDTWLSEVMSICEDHRLEEGDYPEVGGTEGFIIKTDGDNYEKMYFVTTTRLDLAQYTDKKYKHQENFSVNYNSYELPQDYIDRITEIIKKAKQ